MKLYGEILEPPRLRFDFSSTSATDIYTKRGLLKYGPYDSSILEKDKITCAIMFSKEIEKIEKLFIGGLTKGENKFGGFEKFFKVPLEFVKEIPLKDNDDIKLTLDQISTENLDIVYVLLTNKDEDIYKLIKSRLLLNGIPSQVVIAERLNSSDGRQYILENIALATYAKIGGTPWTISTTENKNNLVIGVSRAMDKSRKLLVGFVTLFTNDGDFIFMHSKAPVIQWEKDKYIEGISELIIGAIKEYESKERIRPDSIIVHLPKVPGKEREMKAIEIAFQNLGYEIPHAIIHLNEYSNFRLFDSSHSTYIPERGLKVDLSTCEALLLVDGRIEDKKVGLGIPNVLNIRMDGRSTLSVDRFPELVKQIYDFSFINWRGFNARAVPVTLNYSKLIAKMVIELGPENWNQIVVEGKLRDKSWFL